MRKGNQAMSVTYTGTPPSPAPTPMTLTPSPARGGLTQWLTRYASASSAWTGSNDAVDLFALLFGQTDQLSERQRIAGLVPALFSPVLTNVIVTNTALLTSAQNLITAMGQFATNALTTADSLMQQARDMMTMNSEISDGAQLLAIDAVGSLAMALGTPAANAAIHAGRAMSCLHGAEVSTGAIQTGVAGVTQLANQLRAAVPFVAFPAS